MACVGQWDTFFCLYFSPCVALGSFATFDSRHVKDAELCDAVVGLNDAE